MQNTQMSKATLTRELQLPDDLRVARALSAPHLGPRILCFSGGSAFNAISRQLKRYTYNSVHLITPFDSGGSSQVLREAFDMPAVGDLRSRLMALADETDLGQPDIYGLFSHRLPREGEQAGLRAEVVRLAEGDHPLIRAISQPMGLLIQTALKRFLAAAALDFDFRNASLGNLILAGGYLDNDRQLEPVLFLMSKMVDVRGTVRAVVDENLHLGADLADGRRIIGQRQLSGKEVAPITSPIRRLFLCEREAPQETSVSLAKRNQFLISNCDLICYPPGSLFTSLIANLLPVGVGRTIASRQLPKVYLPSLGHDPEAPGLELVDQVADILRPLLHDAGAQRDPCCVMTHVICDETVSAKQCDRVTEVFGIPCVQLPLLGDMPQRYDPKKVSELLISLT